MERYILLSIASVTIMVILKAKVMTVVEAALLFSNEILIYSIELNALLAISIILFIEGTT